MIFIALINPLFPYTTLFRSCRPPLNEECATLREWRFNYDIETLGAPASDETRRRATHYLDVQIAEGNAWVAVENDRPVSLSSFNATLPDIVQLGGMNHHQASNRLHSECYYLSCWNLHDPNNKLRMWYRYAPYGVAVQSEY